MIDILQGTKTNLTEGMATICITAVHFLQTPAKMNQNVTKNEPHGTNGMTSGELEHSYFQVCHYSISGKSCTIEYRFIDEVRGGGGDVGAHVEERQQDARHSLLYAE